MSEEELESKRQWGLFLAMISLAMVAFVSIEFRYLKNSEVINEKLLDMKLITVNDYAVEIDVTPTMYETFKRDA